MATKKTEKTSEVKKDVTKKASKPKSASKAKKELTPEQSVVILACMNEDFLAKLNKLAEKEGVKIVLTNEQVIKDYVWNKMSDGVDESARMSAFLKDERNRKLAFERANEIFTILTKRQVKIEFADNHVFQKKDLVRMTKLSWDNAEEMLNTLQVFGYVDRMNSKEFKFHFNSKAICAKVLKDVSFSIEGLNFDIQRYKGAVENSDEDDKEKLLADFKAEVQKHIVF